MTNHGHCRDCKWWQEHYVPGLTEIGSCHGCTPFIIDESRAAWPGTRGEGWCRFFERREQQDEMS